MRPAVVQAAEPGEQLWVRAAAVGLQLHAVAVAELVHQVVVASAHVHVPAISKRLKLAIEVAEEYKLGAKTLPPAHGSECAEWQLAYFVDQKPCVCERAVQM